MQLTPLSAFIFFRDASEHGHRMRENLLRHANPLNSIIYLHRDK
jgi:hypothetical protein